MQGWKGRERSRCSSSHHRERKVAGSSPARDFLRRLQVSATSVKWMPTSILTDGLQHLYLYHALLLANIVKCLHLWIVISFHFRNIAAKRVIFKKKKQKEEQIRVISWITCVFQAIIHKNHANNTSLLKTIEILLEITNFFADLD